MRTKPETRKQVEAGASKITRVRKPPVPLEKEVMAQVAAAIKLLGLDLHRNNTGAARLPGKGGRPQLVRFGQVGAGDFAGWLGDGRHAEVEVKRPGQKPRPEQLERLARINAAGGVGVWIDDGAAAYGILKALAGGARIEMDAKGNQWIIDDKENAS